MATSNDKTIFASKEVEINVNDSEEPLSNTLNSTRLYKKRFLILAIFCSFSFSNAYQWIHLNIIATQVKFYYNASLPEDEGWKDITVEWLAMIYMLAYIPLILPSTWLLNHKGLRWCAILATFFNMTGAWFKAVSLYGAGTLYAVLMTGQTFCAVAQVFILGIPANLAAVWFGPNEVSQATALGVFGNQVGVAFGFALPPIIVPQTLMNATDGQELVGKHLGYMFFTGAAIFTVLFILVLIVFKNKPNMPPSRGQLLSTSLKSDYLGSLKALFRNINFWLLTISYGINTGSYYAISTLLERLLIDSFKGSEDEIGWAGFTMIVAGVLGAVLAGVWLDKTKAFKWTTLGIYVLSAVSMLIFTSTIHLKMIWIVFVVMFLLGFFMTGYLPVGFEFAAEITFPENEGTSSGILNASAQFFGIILTLTMGRLISIGPWAANVAVTAFLFGGSIMTATIKNDLRRQRAHEELERLIQ